MAVAEGNLQTEPGLQAGWQELPLSGAPCWAALQATMAARRACTSLFAEMSARALYQEAATHCHSVRDYVTRDLFEKLMHDEEDHIDYLETQLDLVAKLGLELYAQHHIGETDES